MLVGLERRRGVFLHGLIEINRHGLLRMFAPPRPTKARVSLQAVGTIEMGKALGKK
jgi:hypothetical protein